MSQKDKVNEFIAPEGTYFLRRHIHLDHPSSPTSHTTLSFVCIANSYSSEPSLSSHFSTQEQLPPPFPSDSQSDASHSSFSFVNKAEHKDPSFLSTQSSLGSFFKRRKPKHTLQKSTSTFVSRITVHDTVEKLGKPSGSVVEQAAGSTHSLASSVSASLDDIKEFEFFFTNVGKTLSWIDYSGKIKVRSSNFEKRHNFGDPMDARIPLPVYTFPKLSPLATTSTCSQGVSVALSWLSASKRETFCGTMLFPVDICVTTNRLQRKDCLVVNFR
jgi:hypothetical protein